MAMDNLGINFSPMPGAQQQKDGGMASPIQDAIRVMSLRTPKAPGAGSIAQPGLLNAPGAGGLGGSSPMGLEDLIRKLFGMSMPSQAPQMPAAAPSAPAAPAITNMAAPQGPPMAPQGQGQAPAPRILPGLGNAGGPFTPLGG